MAQALILRNNNIIVLKEKIKTIMAKHIGYENGITSRDFFIKVFETKPEKLERLTRYECAGRLSSAIRSLSGSNLFVCAVKTEELGYTFFVPSSKSDLAVYNDFCTLKINNIKNRYKQAVDFVAQKGHKQLL